MSSSSDAGPPSSAFAMHDKRIIIWPVYIDAKKTLKDGRRLPARFCVEFPQMHEIKEVLEHLEFEHVYEEKAYPRDLTQYGRFRVELKDARTGEPKVEGITSRRELLLRICELIPGLKTRKEAKVKPSASAAGLALPGYPQTLMPVAAAAAPAALAQANKAGASSSAAGGGSSKKKGRK